MPFPEWLIEQIRQRIDLVELVGEVVALKRVGKNYAALCPFHSEDTPSFFVHPERGIFKCFGCGKGGNAITFVMEYYRMSFPEAVRFLAQRAGIPLPEEAERSPEHEAHQRVTALYQVLQVAAQFYQEALSRAGGEVARKYLSGRGVRAETVKRFGIGYAPEGWDTLLEHLRQRGFHEALMEEAGLVSRSEHGKPYDRFRHRLMFPIYDPIGRVIGFGARRLREEEAAPKYLNSPATPLYDKSRVLYGLYHARDALRAQGYAVLVEGYLDVITLHQAGIDTAVATAGTALTEEHLRVLRRYCQQVFVVYDADRAGQQATLRALELALRQGFEVKVVLLPEGEDPDSFVRAHGVEAFRLRQRHAIPFLDFVVLQYQRQGILQTPGGQAQAVRHAVRLVAAIPDPLMHDFLLRHLATRFALPERLLYEEFQRQRRESPEPKAAPVRVSPPAPTVPSPPSLGLLPEEEQLLRLVLLSPSLCSPQQWALIEAALLSERARQLWAFLRPVLERGVDPVTAFATDPELQRREETQLLLQLVIVREMPSPKWTQFVPEYSEPDARRLLQEQLLRLQLRRVEEQLRHLQQPQQLPRSWEEEQQRLQRLQELALRRQQLMQQLSGMQ
ncbi:DNA primase [bacterium HR21]|nr:DNA primase [bacterium HR21]